MARLRRYTKSLAALVVGLAAAAALLPTDADPRLLAAGVVLNTLAVWYAKNTPPDPPRRFPPPAPTRWQRGPGS